MTKPRRFFSLFVLIFLIIFSWVFVSFVRAQWQDPTQPFPSGNPAPPLDTGSAAQRKSGSLKIGPSDTQAVELNSARQFLFTEGAITGAIRLNAATGKLEYRNNGAGFLEIGSGGAAGITSINSATGPAIIFTGQNGITVSRNGNTITLSGSGGGNPSGDVTDVLQGVGISVTNSAGPQPSVSIMTTGLTNCGDATTGKVWWDGGKLMCGIDQSAGGTSAWTTASNGSSVYTTNPAVNVGIGLVPNPSYKLHVNGIIRAQGFSTGNSVDIGVKFGDPNTDQIKGDENLEIVSTGSTNKNLYLKDWTNTTVNTRFGIGAIGAGDSNYKLTIKGDANNGGGIKAESTKSGQPGGFFDNTSGGKSIQTGSALAEIGGSLNVVGVYMKNGTSGANRICAAGTTPDGITISGGIVTAAGTTCIPVGGGATSTPSGVWAQSLLPNAIYYNQGNVGVGTAFPIVPLHVQGNMVISNDPTVISNNGLRLYNKGDVPSSGSYSFGGDTYSNTQRCNLGSVGGCSDTNTDTIECSLDSYDLTNGTAGNTCVDLYKKSDALNYMKLYKVENVAGGTWGPPVNLTFQDQRSSIQSGPTFFSFMNNAGTFTITNNNSKVLTMNQSGNFGVGTVNPGAKLEALNVLSDDILKLSRSSSASSLFKVGIDGVMVINNSGTDTMAFKNGNIGIGTNSPNSKLEIDSGTANASGLRFNKLTNVSPAGAAGTKVLSVDANGNVVLVTDATGSNGAFVNLQTSTPGTQQTGNLNIDGTGILGHLETSTFKMATGASAGYVLTTDASGVGTWQQATGGGTSQWQNGADGIYYSAGNVGIGTSQAVSSNNLIIGNSIVAPGIQFLNNRQYSIYAQNGLFASNKVEIWNANAVFTGSSKVGIGTNNPATNLHIMQPGAGDAFRISRIGHSDAALTLSKNSSNRTVLGVGKAGTNLFETVFDLDSGNTGIGTTDPGTAKLAVMGGNVGIGTTLPGYGLHVVGNAKIESANPSDKPTLVLGNKIDDDNAAFTAFCANASNPATCGPEGTSGDTFDGDANTPNAIQVPAVSPKTCNQAKPGVTGDFIDVGYGKIFNVTGYVWRQIHCEAVDVPFYSVQNNAGTFNLSNKDNQIKFALGQDGAFSVGGVYGSGKFTIDSFGKVGIGTASPAVTLDARSSAPDSAGIISVGNSDDSNWVSVFGGRSTNPWPYISWKNTNSALRFGTATDKLGGGFTEAMRIMSTGQVGIGITGPDSDSKLAVGGYVFAKAPVFIYENTTGGRTSANQELSIPWNSDVRFDNNIVQKNTNNYDFTLKKVGWYRINLKLYFYTTQQSSGGGDYFFTLKKNGTDYMAFDTRKTSEGSQNNSAFNDILNDTLLVDSDSNDIIKITAEKITGANTGDLFIETVPHNYLSIEYLGSN